MQLIELANSIQVGEIILTSVSFEGEMMGFDNELYKRFLPDIVCPVIVNGGSGCPEDFTKLETHKFISGYSAASMFAYTQYTPKDIKEALSSIGVSVRL